MKNKYYFLAVFVMILLVMLSSCGVFSEESAVDDVEQRVATYQAQTQEAETLVEIIVAQTMAAINKENQTQMSPEATLIPTSTPTIANSPTPTATATPTSAPTLTPTTASAAVFAEVSVPTNCRTGPGKIYDRVSVLDVNKRVEVIARNADRTYWVVENPAGSGTCWLWDKYATVTGQIENLPVWSAPPTPTPQAVTTPSTTGVVLKVSVPTNCRVGPGKLYDKVSILYTGKTANVVARHPSEDYWVIENPAGSGTCWVWGYYATVTGPVSSLPVWTPNPPPAPSAVTLQVRVDTNCRSGPGKAYDIITILRIGKTAEVLARNNDQTYWVITNPAGAGHCWVWGYYATVTGPISSLPIWDAPDP